MAKKNEARFQFVTPTVTLTVEGERTNAAQVIRSIVSLVLQQPETVAKRTYRRTTKRLGRPKGSKNKTVVNKETWGSSLKRTRATPTVEVAVNGKKKEAVAA